MAAEGCFSITRKLPPFADGSIRRRFVFSIQMASRDRPLLEQLRGFLGFGSICERPPGRPGWQPTSTLMVNSLRAHHAATIPFAEQFLLPSAKRRQFGAWRDALEIYELEHPTKWGKGRSTCSKPGCTQPVRAHGLCRRHLYQERGV